MELPHNDRRPVSSRPDERRKRNGVNIGSLPELAIVVDAPTPGAPVPCDGERLNDGGNRLLFDLDGNASVDLSDAIHLLSYLFQGGDPPGSGGDCIRIEGCPSRCFP